MAGRLILFNNDADQIKGTCEAEGYAGILEVDHLSFAATAYAHTDSSTGTAHQSSKSAKPPGPTEQSAITVSLPFGPWIADFQQRLFHGKTLGKVTITEVEQKVDGTKKTWKKIREITLTEAWMESMSHSWSGIQSSVSFRVQYQDMTLSHGDKIASFNRGEK